MEAAKRKTFWLMWIASAILLSLPALASSVDVLHAKTRAELQPENGQFSVEQQALNPANATRYYDWLEEVASESSVAPKGTQAAFDAAQQAWKQLPPDVRRMMHGINEGTRPLSDFTNLPVPQRQAILDYFRATGGNASKANAEAVRQLNQHRLDFLNGLRPDPPGGIGNFPKSGGGS